MKLSEIKRLDESMYSIISDLTKNASQELFDYDYVYRTRGGMRMFTRMDGMKYRDPNIIFFGNDDAIETLKDYKSGEHKYASKESKAKWHPIWTKMAKTDAYTGIQQFWDWLQQQPGVKKANFRVSGEFGSSKHRDVLVYGKYIFINDGTEVQYGTKSLLRNSPIWRVEKINEGVFGNPADKKSAIIKYAGMKAEDAIRLAELGIELDGEHAKLFKEIRQELIELKVWLRDRK